MLESLKREVWQANLDLVKHNLVVLTWGNVSAIDRESGLVVIKPSGVVYDDLKPEDMVVIDLDGNILEGPHKPSSELPFHQSVFLLIIPFFGSRKPVLINTVRIRRSKIHYVVIIQFPAILFISGYIFRASFD